MVSKELIIQVQRRFNIHYSALDLNEEDKMILVYDWCEAFKDYTEEEFTEAVKKSLTTCTFRPKMCDILEIIKAKRLANFIPEEVWNDFINRILPKFAKAKSNLKNELILEGNTITERERAIQGLNSMFPKLHPALQQMYGSYQVILEICGLEVEQVVFEKAKFIKNALNLIESAELNNKIDINVALQDKDQGKLIINEINAITNNN